MSGLLAHAGGRAFVFGDNIDTDVLAPGLYMKGGIDELAKHCLESVDAGFAASRAEKAS
jgi:3-isopropylmalate/(R)-2-methylmalate dehydratase small subunit